MPALIFRSESTERLGECGSDFFRETDISASLKKENFKSVIKDKELNLSILPITNWNVKI